jgi:hypothetical protein
MARFPLLLVLLALASRIVLSIDTDDDGADDGFKLDACPGSVRSSRDHVDGHGGLPVHAPASADGR